MKNILKLFLVVTFITFFINTGCDNLFSSNKIKCKDFILEDGVEYTATSTANSSPSAPCYNPNNANEIMYVENKRGSGSEFIVKYNLVTKEKEYIHESVEPIYFSNPKWGRNDFIIMQKATRIWKIKSNGDSLIQVSKGGFHNANWNYGGTKIYCGMPIVGLIMDVDGVILDTFSAWGPSVTTHPRYSIYQGPDIANGILGLSIKDVENDTTAIVATIENTTCIGFEWLDNETIIWSTYEGIFQTNIMTKNTIQILSSCSSILYTDPTFHPNSGKVIWHKVSYELIMKENKLLVTNQLVSMNPDGSEKKIIELD